MVTPRTLQTHFAAGLTYDAYVATGSPDQQAAWRASHARLTLTPRQRGMVEAFVRRVNILVLSGTWCGDCVQQCPMLDHLARVKPAPGSPTHAPGVDLRFVDRETHHELSHAVMICGGRRVPTVIFMNEDHEFVSILGDRTLSRYRSIAAQQLGPSCPLPGAALPPDEAAATLEDWAQELERVHLLLRLSAKLRERHGD